LVNSDENFFLGFLPLKNEHFTGLSRIMVTNEKEIRVNRDLGPSLVVSMNRDNHVTDFTSVTELAHGTRDGTLHVRMHQVT